MAIVQTVGLYEFREAFKRYNRQDQFSYEGLEILFEYLEQHSDDTGEAIKLDVGALCCEYYESSIEEIIDNYDIDVSGAADEFEKVDIVRGYLTDSTTVCGEIDDGFVYAAF